MTKEEPPKKKSKRLHVWKHEYTRDYGARPIETDPVTNEVTRAECLFCATFGREERVPKLPQVVPVKSGVPAKKTRARTRNVATWKPPFRTDNMRSHHQEQHPRKWREYVELLAAVKKQQALQLTARGGAAASNDETGAENGDMHQSLAEQLTTFFMDGDTAKRPSIHTQPPALGRKQSRSEMRCSTSVSSMTPKMMESSHSMQGQTIGANGYLKQAFLNREALVLPVTEMTNLAIVNILVAAMISGEDYDTATIRARERQVDNAETCVKSVRDDVNVGNDGSPAPSFLFPMFVKDTEHREKAHENGSGFKTGSAFPGQVAKYAVVIKNKEEFIIVQQMLRLGMRFDQVANVVSLFGSSPQPEIFVSPQTVREYAELSVAMTLQMISDLMIRSWTFALVFEISIDECSNAAMDIRVRLPTHSGQDVVEFHVLAVPLLQFSHSADGMVTFIESVLATLDIKWKAKLIGASVHGATNALGVHSKLIQQLSSYVDAPFYEVQQPSHELEVALGRAFDELQNCPDPGTEFLAVLNTLVRFIRAQESWVRVHGRCVTFNLNVPNSVLITLGWLKARHETINQLCQATTNHVVGTPHLDSSWWVMCFALVEALGEYESTLRSFVDLSVKSPAYVKHELTKLMEKIMENCNISLVDEDSSQAGDCAQYVFQDRCAKLGPFEWSQDHIIMFLRSRDALACRFYDELVPQKQIKMQQLVARFLLCFMCEVRKGCTVGNDDSRNLAPSKLMKSTWRESPPTQPIDFIAMDRTAIENLIGLFRTRLEIAFGHSFLDSIGNDFDYLQTQMESDPPLKAVFQENQGNMYSFHAAWAPLAEKCPSIRTLAAGLATVLPQRIQPLPYDTNSVIRFVLEAEDAYRTCRTDLLIEAQLHALQYDYVQQACAAIEVLAVVV